MEAATATRSIPLPAFRVVRGDVVRLNGALYTVTSVEQTARYSLNRNRPLPASDRHGVRLTLKPRNPRRRYATLLASNTDLVRVVR